jgi:hypothetical protein
MDRLVYLVIVLVAFGVCAYYTRKADGHPYKED